MKCLNSQTIGNKRPELWTTKKFYVAWFFDKHNFRIRHLFKSNLKSNFNFCSFYSYDLKRELIIENKNSYIMTKNILIKISIGISRFLFVLGCIFMAVFMCHKQYIHYRSNQDSSSVANRRFEDGNEDIYPTFSICYHGEHGQIFKSYYMDDMAKCLSSCND